MAGWARFKLPGYKEWRLAVFDRANWRCEECGKAGDQIKKTGLDAHHRKSWARYKSLRLEVSNGVALCRSCHMKEHGRRKRRQGRWI